VVAASSSIIPPRAVSNKVRPVRISVSGAVGSVNGKQGSVGGWEGREEVRLLPADLQETYLAPPTGTLVYSSLRMGTDVKT
jgi:hypothetical protein